CRRSDADGARVACAGSGAGLLAEPGRYGGWEGTSRRVYCDWLSQRYPGARWLPERGLLPTGTDRRLLMSGSGVAWHMLVLALVARHAGPAAAMQVGRINLMDVDEVSAMASASLTRGSRA